jgi:hypothetical protein
MWLLSRIAPALLLCSLLSAQNPTADFFVSPKGKDTWSGKLAAPNSAATDGPFASISRAQAALRELRKANPNQPRSVMLRGGTYYLPLSPTDPGTLKLTAFDSGTNAFPITWQNYPGETPIISGGVPVGKDGLRLTWKQPANAKSASLWQVQLPASTQPFEYLFYNSERRLRSRIQSASGAGYYMRGSSCYSTVTKQTVDKSLCNLGTFLRIAAEIPATGENADCPAVARTDHPSIKKCLDRFIYDANDPIASWINLNNNDTSCPPSTSPSKDYPAGDVELTLFSAWTVDIMRVSCVNTTKHIIYLSGGTKGDSVNYDSFGPVAGHRYIVENTKDAFDAAAAAGQTGLWFLDRSATPWTLNYLANRGENPNNDSVVIAQVQPVTPTGGSLISAIYLDAVTFRGITFEVDNYIPPALGFNNDELSDDTLPEAIDCISCEDVVFDGITVRHTSSSGIQLASGSGDIDRPPTNNKVLNSAFYDIGDSGIRIGKHALGSDRPNHVIQFATIENNIIQGYSRVFADGIGISQANGHDVAYRHNDITDGYHAGLTVCHFGCPAHTANGFNITAEYNHIWNVMQGITSDGGALYLSVGAPNGTGENNKITSNLIHDVTDSSAIDTGMPGYGYGGHGIFLDNKSAAVEVTNNVVFHVSDSNVAISEGPPKHFPANTIHNNIFASARKSVFKFSSPWWPEGCAEKQVRVNFTNNLVHFDRKSTDGFQVVQGCSYSCGLDYNQFQNFQGNLYWRSGGGFATDPKAFQIMTNPPADPAQCKASPEPANSTFLTFAQWQNGAPPNGSPGAMKEDVSGTTSVNPGFGKLGQPKDYLLTKSPIAGFDFNKTNDTIKNAGRSHPVIMPPKFPPTFHTI